MQTRDLRQWMKGRERSPGDHVERWPARLVMVWRWVAMEKTESKTPLRPLANMLVYRHKASIYIRRGGIRQQLNGKKMNSTQISVRDNWARRDDSNRSWIGESRSGAGLWVISTEVMTDSLLKKIIHWCGSSRKKRLEKQTLWAPAPKTQLRRKRPKSSEKQMTLQPVNPREVTITRILLVLSQVAWKGQWEK